MSGYDRRRRQRTRAIPHARPRSRTGPIDRSADRRRQRTAAPPRRRWRLSAGPLADLFLSARFFRLGLGVVVLFVCGAFWPPALWAARAAAFAFAAATFADVLLLWATRSGGLQGTRELDDKLSMGDENEVRLTIRNLYRTRIVAHVLDEAPVQFQHRHAGTPVALAARGHEGDRRSVTYSLRPTERGAYGFGYLLLYAQTRLGLVLRRFRAAEPAESAVYPSIQQMRRYAFLAESNRLEEAGLKRVRRVGQTLEFDQVRSYVPGDDRRTINWKATARRGLAHGGAGAALLVNQYEEERAQPVIAAVDMGRTMRSPFDGLTLLDHAINSSLVLLNTALIKGDRAGLLTFDHEVRTILPPARGRTQLSRILESLYRQSPSFRDPSYEALYAAVRGRLKRRGLVLLFTNFDTRAGMERQLPYLSRIAKQHRLVVVFSENTGIRELTAAPAESLEGVYVKSTAQALAMEKREIARALERRGIGALLTSPEALTVDTVNRYLQIKARGAF